MPELTRKEIDDRTLKLLIEFGHTPEQAQRILEGPKCPYIPYEGQFSEPWTAADAELMKNLPKPKPYIPSFSAYERAKKLCQKKQ
jgi:hypothetical protein